MVKTIFEGKAHNSGTYDPTITTTTGSPFKIKGAFRSSSSWHLMPGHDYEPDPYGTPMVNGQGDIGMALGTGETFCFGCDGIEKEHYGWTPLEEGK